MSNILSIILSFISILCYISLYIPQILNIYRLKTSNGLSIYGLMIWCSGDAFNLINIGLQKTLRTNLLIIGISCSIMTYILYISVLFYYNYENVRKKIFFLTSSISLIILQISIIFIIYFYSIEPALKITLSNIFIWFYLITIVSSKLPQIYKNYKKKFIYELSLYLHIFSALGNTFYVLSLFVDYFNIMNNIYWIVSGCIILILDFVLIGQWLYYKKHENTIAINNI